MSSIRTSPSTTAEQEQPTTVHHALGKDLKGVVEVLQAESHPNMNACLQQLRVVVSQVQRSVDLVAASVRRLVKAILKPSTYGVPL